MQEFIAAVYNKDATIDPTSKVIISASGNDEFDLTADKKGTDGSGHLLITDSTYCANVQFENSNTILYNVALKYAIKPEGIVTNPRTGYPEFDRWVEFYGESADPTSVVDNTTYITFNVNSVCPDSSESHAGRKCLVWKNTPALGATSEALAMEICTVYYSGGNNLIDTSTSGVMGQATVSTTAADYTVLMLGPSVARVANVDFEPLDDYWYIGTLTGAGVGDPPTIPGTSVDDQRLASYSLSDLLEGYISDQKFDVMAIHNWWPFETGKAALIEAVCGGFQYNAEGDYEWFVAVGDYPTGDAELWISREGKYWQEIASGSGVYDLYAVTFDKNIDSGKWVAVGQYRTGTAMTVVTCNYTDTNGPGGTWTLRTCNAPSGTPSLVGIASNGSVFVAVGTNDASGYAVIFTSSSVTTWTNRGSSAAITGDLIDICYGNGLFVAVGYNGTSPLIVTSPDGITWTSRTSASSNRVLGVCWNGSVFVAVGDNGDIQYSSDGISWSLVNIGGSSMDIYRVASNNNGVLIATVINSTQGKLIYSTDNALTWHDITGIDNAVAANSYRIHAYGITYEHSKWVAVGFPQDYNEGAMWSSIRTKK